MPSTYTLISSNVLTSSAASVTFSAIPSTYTDLVLRFSARTDQAGQVDSLIKINVNSLTTTIYSDTELRGDGSTASSGRDSSVTAFYNGAVAGASATSNTFASCEIYLPNYSVAQNKPVGSILTNETNATAVRMSAVAGLIRSTAIIDSVAVAPFSGSVNFVSGSSFYLYGIKNS